MELTFNQLSNANSPWNLPNIPFFDIITHWSYFKNRGGVIVFCISNTFVHFRRVCPTLPFNEDITSISSTAITDNSAQSFFLRTLLSIMWSAAITAVYLCFIFFAHGGACELPLRFIGKRSERMGKHSAPPTDIIHEYRQKKYKFKLLYCIVYLAYRYRTLRISRRHSVVCGVKVCGALQQLENGNEMKKIVFPAKFIETPFSFCCCCCLCSWIVFYLCLRQKCTQFSSALRHSSG